MASLEVHLDFTFSSSEHYLDFMWHNILTFNQKKPAKFYYTLAQPKLCTPAAPACFVVFSYLALFMTEINKYIFS